MSKILYTIIALVATIALAGAAPLTTDDVVTLPYLGEVTVKSTTDLGKTTFEVLTSLTYEEYQAIDNQTKVDLIVPPLQAVKDVVPAGEKYGAILTVRASNGKALLVYVTSDIAAETNIHDGVKFANEKGRV